MANNGIYGEVTVAWANVQGDFVDPYVVAGHLQENTRRDQPDVIMIQELSRQNGWDGPIVETLIASGYQVLSRSRPDLFEQYNSEQDIALASHLDLVGTPTIIDVRSSASHRKPDAHGLQFFQLLDTKYNQVIAGCHTHNPSGLAFKKRFDTIDAALLSGSDIIVGDFNLLFYYVEKFLLNKHLWARRKAYDVHVPTLPYDAQKYEPIVRLARSKSWGPKAVDLIGRAAGSLGIMKHPDLLLVNPDRLTLNGNLIESAENGADHNWHAAKLHYTQPSQILHVTSSLLPRRQHE